jgi:hypothetical protein
LMAWTTNVSSVNLFSSSIMSTSVIRELKGYGTPLKIRNF